MPNINNAWGPHQPMVVSWRCTASPRDRFLLGKLVLPDSLVMHLREALGPRQARIAVSLFHRCALPLLAALLPAWTPAEKQSFKRRLSPYAPDGWDIGPTQLPQRPSHRTQRRTPATPAPRATRRAPSTPAAATHRPQPSIRAFFQPLRPPSPDQCP